MKTNLFFVGMVLLAFFVLGCYKQVSFPTGRWVDLSYDYSPETIFWPTAERFKLEVVAAGITDKGYYYAANRYSASEHGGTHIDAPIHFAQGGRTVEQIPLQQLIGPAVVIDVSEKALANRDYLISVDDITTWEVEHGLIPKDLIVLFHTGYGRYWPDPVRYMGTDKRGMEAIAELHFPGLSPEAARWLVDNRFPKVLGIDTPSIDYGQSQMFESHQILMGENIPAFENVANMNQLPETGTLIIALPMKIKGGGGGPLRIIALVPE